MTLSRRHDGADQRHFGRREAAVDAARARAEQAMLQFGKTVQGAFRDVEDALVERRKTAELRTHQEVLVGHLQRTRRLANQRHDEGLVSYLEVLDAELDLAQVQRAQLAAVVRLYAALGVGWQATGNGQP